MKFTVKHSSLRNASRLESFTKDMLTITLQDLALNTLKIHLIL